MIPTHYVIAPQEACVYFGSFLIEKDGNKLSISLQDLTESEKEVLKILVVGCQPRKQLARKITKDDLKNSDSVSQKTLESKSQISKDVYDLSPSRNNGLVVGILASSRYAGMILSGTLRNKRATSFAFETGVYFTDPNFTLIPTLLQARLRPFFSETSILLPYIGTSAGIDFVYYHGRTESLWLDGQGLLGIEWGLSDPFHIHLEARSGLLKDSLVSSVVLLLHFLL